VAPRAALYLMPSMAVLATAVLVLGPGRERPAVGARVWGVPAAGATKSVWRVETVERQFGADQTVPAGALELSVEQAGRRLAVWSGATGDDGVVEAPLEVSAPLAGSIEVQLRRGNTLLAQGPVALRAVAPPAFEARAVNGNAQGAITLRVEITRGVLASPFHGELRVRATRDGQPAASVTLRATAEGAQVFEPGLLPTTDARGEVTLRLQPTWHSVELHIEATQGQGDAQVKGSWDGTLPVKPGALWLSVDPARGSIASPAPRDRAYVSGLSEHGRVFGAVVPLVKTNVGLFCRPASSRGSGCGP
jgi:hypothetical protein